MKKLLLSMMALALCLGLLPTAALAATAADVTYYDWNSDTKGLEQKTCASATAVTSNDTQWIKYEFVWMDENGGWYVVNSDVTIENRVTVTGDVRLILADGCTLTVNGGIQVTVGDSLTIYGQENGTGALITTGDDGKAGIGGGYNGDGGTVTIHGGKVTATGGYGGAGIGGGYKGAGGTVTINGGTVNATGGNGGAGIGGGYKGAGGTVTIHGGTVTATGGSDDMGTGAGIGGGSIGDGGTVTINGGTVTATNATDGEPGIGGGNGGGSGSFRTQEAGEAKGSAMIFAASISDRRDEANWSGIIFPDWGAIQALPHSGTVYGEQTLPAELFIFAGYTLTIPADASLTVPGGKTLSIRSDATLTNNGALYCAGDTIINGTLTNNGTIYVDGILTKTETGTVSGDGVRYYLLTLRNCKVDATKTAEANTSTVNGKTFGKVGETIYFTATPSANQLVKDWDVTTGAVGVPSGTDPNKYIIMSMPAKPVTVKAELETALTVTKPDDKTIDYGQTTTLSVTVSKHSALNGSGFIEGYQWYLDGSHVHTTLVSNYSTPTDLAAGDHTYTCTITYHANMRSYTVTSDAATVTVNKAASTLTAAPTANTLVYNGSEQALVAAGSASGGAMQYSPDGTRWSTDIPTGKDAKTYTVSYKVVGDSNHNDGASGSVNVTIAPKPVDIQWGSTTLTYNGSKQCPTATATGLASGDTCNITVTGGQTNAGSYTATATGLDNSNYQLPVSGTTQSFTISPKVLTASDLEYTGSAITKEYDGNQTCSLTSVSVKDGVLAGTDTLTVHGTAVYDSANAGSRTVTFTPDAITTGNYTLADTETLTIQGASITRKAVTATVTVTSRAYDGTTDATVSAEVTEGLISGDTITITGLTGTFETANAGTDKTVTVNAAGMAITGTGSGNYTVTVPGTAAGTITKAAAPTLDDISVRQKYTVSTQQSKDIGRAGMPADAGDLTYAKGTVSFGDVVSITGWDVDSTGKVTYTLSSSMPSRATLRVIIGSDNYENATVKVNIELTEKDVPTANANDITVTYTGSAVPADAITGTASVAGTWSFKDEAPVTVADSSDSVTVVFTPADTANYETVEDTIKVTINKATPTGRPAYTAITSSGKTLADAALTVGRITPVGGSIAWDVAADTAVTANTAYNWTYTPTDTDNYNTLTGSITPYVVSSSGGGSSSTTTTEKNPDGSTTTTVTDKTTGTVTETTKNTDGSTTVVETKKDGTVTETNKSANGTTGTVVTDKNGDITDVSASVSNKAANEAAKSGDAVKLPVEIPVAKSTEDAPAVDVTVPKSAGSVKIEIPVENVTPGTVAVIVKADGTEEIVSTSIPTETGVVLPLDGNATVKIVDNAKVFVDIHPVNHWAEDAVDFASARGITGGTSDTTFSPNAPCTRAQIVTFLWRAAGCPEPESLSSLSDVPADAYYAKAVAWALENGITTGTSDGTTFSPNAPCPRAQAMTFIYRSEQAQGGGMQGAWMFQNPFSDVDLENYYGEAVMWAVANGVTGGTTATTFSPNNDCTRAQIVTFLFRSTK